MKNILNRAFFIVFKFNPHTIGCVDDGFISRFINLDR